MIRLAGLVLLGLAIGFGALLIGPRSLQPGRDVSRGPDAGPPSRPAWQVRAGTRGLKGIVRERIDADGRSYLRLQAQSSEVWVAAPSSELELGARVIVAEPRPVEVLVSEALGRRFAPAVEGAFVWDPRGGSTPEGVVEAPSARPAAAPQVELLAIDQTYARRAALDGRTIAVRGRVARLTTRTLGKTFLHLDDGTGDLVVVTTGRAREGETVHARGVLRTDRDYGAGHRFAVALEDAELWK